MAADPGEELLPPAGPDLHLHDQAEHCRPFVAGVVYKMYTLGRTTSSGGPHVAPVPQILRTFSSDVLTSLGVPDDDAVLVADSLVQADLWGHQSHGCCGCPGTPPGCAAVR